jgi:hypothetical protein
MSLYSGLMIRFCMREVDVSSVRLYWGSDWEATLSTLVWNNFAALFEVLELWYWDHHHLAERERRWIPNLSYPCLRYQSNIPRWSSLGTICLYPLPSLPYCIVIKCRLWAVSTRYCRISGISVKPEANLIRTRKEDTPQRESQPCRREF